MDVVIEDLLQVGVRTSRAVYALEDPHGTYAQVDRGLDGKVATFVKWKRG